MVECLVSEDPRGALDDKHRTLYDYVIKLTLEPANCCKEDIHTLRQAGADDLEIHATVQVAAYFNYINRVADSLGVDLEPEMQAPNTE